MAAVLLTLPIVTWALLLLQPTSDDWTYLTRPQVYSKWETYLFLPSSNYWRPFDALIGSLLGTIPAAFPALNHILVLTAHVASTLAVNKICNISVTTVTSICCVAFFCTCWSCYNCIIFVDAVIIMNCCI